MEELKREGLRALLEKSAQEQQSTVTEVDIDTIIQAVSIMDMSVKP